MCYLLTKQTPFIQCTELQIERRAPGEGKQVLEMWLPIKLTETRRVECSIAKLLDHNLSQLGWSKSMWILLASSVSLAGLLSSQGYESNSDQ